MGCSLGISRDAQKEADDEEGIFSKSQSRNDSDSSPSKKTNRSPLKKIFKKGGTLEREKAKKDAEAKQENGDAKETIANGGSAESDLATKLTPPVVVVTDLEPLEAEVNVENGEAEKTDEIQAEEDKDGPATDVATAVQVESNQIAENGKVVEEPSKDQEKPIDDASAGEVKDTSEPVANASQDAENSIKEESVANEAPTTEASQLDGDKQIESKVDVAAIPNKEEPEVDEKESVTPPHESSDAKIIPEFAEALVTDALIQAESMVRSEESTTSSLSTLSSSTITPVEGSTDGASPVSDEQSEPSKSEVAEEEDAPSSHATEDADIPAETAEEKPQLEETVEEKAVEDAVASEVDSQPEALQEDEAAQENLAEEKSENTETHEEDSIKESEGNNQVQAEIGDDVAVSPDQVEVSVPAEERKKEEAPASSEQDDNSTLTEETKTLPADAMKAASSAEQLDDYINEIAEEAQRQLDDGTESPDVKEVMETQQRQEETELAEALIEVEKAAAVNQAVAAEAPLANQAEAEEEAGDRAKKEEEATEGEAGTQGETDSGVTEDALVAEVAKSSKILPDGIFDDKDEEEVIPDSLGEDYEVVDDQVEEYVEEQKEDEPESMVSVQIDEEQIIPEAAPKKVLLPDEEISESDAKGDNNAEADPEVEASEEKDEVGQGESLQSFAATLVNEAITQAETTALERMNEENSEAAGEEIPDEVASDQKPENAEESGVSETEKVEEEGADEASAASGENIPFEVTSEAAISEQVPDDSEAEKKNDEQISETASQEKTEVTTDAVESPVSPVESSPDEKAEVSEISENVEDVTDEVSQEASKDSRVSTSANDEKPSFDVSTGAAEETPIVTDEGRSAQDVTDETSNSAESNNVEDAAKSKTESFDEPEKPSVEDVSTSASLESSVVSTPSK